MSQSQRPAGRAVLAVTALESRLTPASTSTAVAAGAAAGSALAASVSGPVVSDAAGEYAVGSRTGAGTAALYSSTGTLSFQVAPFGADFTGGVRVALADVNGDGVDDLIAAAGPGGSSAVAVYDGSTQAEIASFTAYESTFTGGTYVAAADLNGDGYGEIVTGADLGGGPRVRVFDGSSVSSTGTAATTTPSVLADFMAIDDDSFRGGVRLALGDMTGDGVADLVVGAGFGGGPRVAAFDGASLADGQEVRLFADFFAYEPGLRNGVFPAVGDLNGDGRGDLVFGAGPGGGPRVRALDGRGALAGRQSEISNFFAGDQSNRSGVQVGVSTAADGSAAIVGTDLATDESGCYRPDGTALPALAGTSGTGSGADTTATATGTTSAAGLGDGGPGRGGHGGRGPGGGQFGGPAFTGSVYTVADLDTLTAAVENTYTGTAAGSVTTLSGTGSDLATADADAAVTLTITGTEAIVGPDADASDSTTPLRGLTVTGTLSITVNGVALDVPVTGTLRFMRDRNSSESTDTASVRGTLVLYTDRTGTDAPAAGTGVALTGLFEDGDLTVSRLVATDRTTTPGTLFQSPTSRDQDRPVLTTA